MVGKPAITHCCSLGRRRKSLNCLVFRPGRATNPYSTRTSLSAVHSSQTGWSSIWNKYPVGLSDIKEIQIGGCVDVSRVKDAPAAARASNVACDR